MTQLFNPDGTVSAVTVLEAGPCRVLGLRTKEKDGYEAARIAFEPLDAKRMTQARAGVFKSANVDPHRHVVEIRGYDGIEQGQELKAEIFAAGEIVDVTSTSKGKGFQGLIKRHKFSRGPESHGSMNVRQPGAIGARWPTPARAPLRPRRAPRFPAAAPSRTARRGRAERATVRRASRA